MLVGGALALAYLAVAVWQTTSDPKQWDLVVYRAAALAAAQGEDPYAVWIPRRNADDTLSSEENLPFVYPPHVAAALGRLTERSASWPLGERDPTGVDTVFLLYLALKLIAAVLLLVVWQRFFAQAARQAPGHRALLRARDRWWMLATLLFLATVTFRETLLRDLYAGNVSVFEQLALWTGLLALCQRRLLLAAVAIALAGSVKWTWFALLPLILVAPCSGVSARRRVAALATGLGAFLLFVSSGFASPYTYAQWWNQILTIDERGRMNPSSLAAWRDLTDLLTWPAATATWLWLVTSCVVGGLTLWFVRRKGPAPAFETILLATTALALVLPRMKDYSYLLLIPAGWYVLASVSGRRVVLLLALAFASVHVLPYQSLLLAAGTWLVIVTRFGDSQRLQPGSSPRSPG